MLITFGKWFIPIFTLLQQRMVYQWWRLKMEVQWILKGAMDEEAGEVLMAFIVKKPEAEISQSEIIDFVSKQVAPKKKVRKENLSAHLNLQLERSCDENRQTRAKAAAYGLPMVATKNGGPVDIKRGMDERRPRGRKWHLSVKKPEAGNFQSI
ncbi:AMP-dependent synthetase/ligase, AMP-binding enzyme C-terminal domain protein [Artemisia annua]|uniref:AMP-dependent synthetase/ligase, AMP-binding enzyme C-terminal domain protein n=1 Tax=Artemisia annua TaxID=35608 RepID=A0A2U1MT60_ARTAN|nr:AMP-dependent synthetase/ligase, AMP-binding enzyme C-terminal domain protein [Artemisia annua]